MNRLRAKSVLLRAVLLWVVALPALTIAQEPTTYRVLATNKTSTMQKEMQEAGATGFRFVAVMGGETAFGGKEVVVLMQKTATSPRFEYRLLATTKTSTMQKELQEAADAGFEFLEHTVFESLFGGKEVTAILERDPAATSRERYESKLIATNRTSTLQKELQEVGNQGFQALGMTVAETAIGGSELVVITRRKLK
jgi:hypothetical protein